MRTGLGTLFIECTRTTALENGEATYRPGPFTAGQTSVLTFVFRDALFNDRYGGADLAAGALTLQVTAANQSTSQISVDNVTFYPENATVDSNGVSRKGKYFVRFTPEMAGLLSIRFAIGGESLVNPDDGWASRTMLATSCAVLPFDSRYEGLQRGG